jgi:hypothetical protein
MADKGSPPIKVLVFSWNVGNAQPKEEELAQWCPQGGAAFDLVVVGTQENKCVVSPWCMAMHCRVPTLLCQ